MPIIIQLHLKIRMRQRLIPTKYPKLIFNKTKSSYVDILTNHSIKVKKLIYNGKLRPMVIAYDIIGTTIEIITVYPTTDREISNRIKNRRWIKDEKN